MIQTRWEHFPQGADVGVRGIGPTKEDAFEQAAVALTAVITDPNAVAAREAIDITCEAPDDEHLLVDWLNALVYQTATRRMLFGRFEVYFNSHRLHGRAWGEPIDVARHQPAVEVKGATLTCLHVRPDAEANWVAQCVIDV
jgi:tRNA nucleotidyltransferase (CCA-adding enzyme)